MAEFTVTKTQISAGIWEGVVDYCGTGTPRNPVLDCVQAGTRLDGISFTADPEQEGRWIMRIAIPPHLISDGVQVFQIVERDSAETIGQFAILADEPVDDGLRDEVALLRGEVDLLKKALRRLAVEH